MVVREKRHDQSWMYPTTQWMYPTTQAKLNQEIERDINHSELLEILVRDSLRGNAGSLMTLLSAPPILFQDSRGVVARCRHGGEAVVSEPFNGGERGRKRGADWWPED